MPRDSEIRREIELPAEPEQVWQAIATGAGLAAWFMPMPDPDPASEVVTAWDPPKRLAVRPPAAGDGSTQSFEYLIEAVAGGTSVLRFTHGFAGGDWSAEFFDTTGQGWDMYLHTLAEYLTHFAGRPAAYVEADGPASTARPAAWPALLAALGLPQQVTVGERVRLTPSGLPPIEGVADWVSGNVLGVRTDDSLYRFHRRDAIGLPVAVGHHHYRSGVAVADEVAAWRDWLAGALHSGALHSGVQDSGAQDSR